MAGDDDKRTAVEFSVTLSGQLISAALAMLAVLAGYAAYIMDNRTAPVLFQFLSVLAAIAFIISIFLAGKAITKARNAGYDGNWSLEVGKSQFNLQAIFCAFGLILFIVSLFSTGPSTADKTETIIAQLRTTDEATWEEIQALLGTNATTAAQIAHARDEIETLRNDISQVGIAVKRLQLKDKTFDTFLRQRDVSTSNLTQSIIASLDRIVMAINLREVVPNYSTVPDSITSDPSGKP